MVIIKQDCKLLGQKANENIYLETRRTGIAGHACLPSSQTKARYLWSPECFDYNFHRPLPLTMVTGADGRCRPKCVGGSDPILNCPFLEERCEI